MLADRFKRSVPNRNDWLPNSLAGLTVALALVQRPRVASVRYPSEDVMVG